MRVLVTGAFGYIGTAVGRRLALAGHDVVCHLAGLGLVRESFERPAEYLAAEQAVATATVGGALGAVSLRIFNAAGAVAGVADTSLSRVIPKALAVAEEGSGRPIPVTRNPPRNEPRSLVSDHRRIGAELGWAPARSALREIVADAWHAISRP